MQRSLMKLLLSLMLAFTLMVVPAVAQEEEPPESEDIEELFRAPNDREATNSDMAFWANRAYQGDYGGFRIFDVSNPAAPEVLSNFDCHGPQNDPVVWKNQLLFLAIDRTLTGPECGATETEEHDDPTGWEGVRVFDVSDPANPEYITGVYTDCGAHTITMYPKDAQTLLLYVSSYPLRPGPTCGPERGPLTGNSPLHEKISVIKVPVHAPQASRVIAQPKVSYPGDLDNQFDPAEHGLEGFNPLTACHDIGVFAPLRLAAAACAEQSQLWRIKPNGIPDTQNPLWVFDDNVDTDGEGGGDVAVDFWHSATFSWDGRTVNFIDESFGNGCPPVTPGVGDTGRMFFVDTVTGRKLSHFMMPREEEGAYCSAHLGVPVASMEDDLLVNAWYEGGLDVIDFSDPTAPEEIAWFDALPAGPEGSNNWSAYWYEGPSLPGSNLTIYGTDISHGFQVLRGDVDAEEVRLPRLNPQTQEFLLGEGPNMRRLLERARQGAGIRPFQAPFATPRAKLSPEARERVLEHLAP